MTNIHGSGMPTSNPNLLDNPWSQINQRGKTEYIGKVYGVDRWFAQNNMEKVVVQDSYVTLVPGTDYSSFAQHIERFSELANKTVTLSAIVRGVAGQCVGLYINPWDYGDGVYLTGANWQLISVTMNLANLARCEIAIYADRSGNKNRLDVRAVKLELGPASTLAYDAPPNYQQELAKCQRYFYSTLNNDGERGALSREAFNVSTANISYGSGAEFPVEMRTVPTITLYSGVSRTAGKVAYGTDGADCVGLAEAQFVGKTGFRQIRILDDPHMPGNQASFHYTADAEIY
ncbi:hypothetical protein RWV98_03030 [Agathobaculum sp. NTUH-O15-33]|uniref:hypothetical protein n=1 Tax=Agathobaculum sp. NTUH-O15-33 TaxID=3079302 RepID=UPI0029587F8B|nr:hypothetical protein [Agathobaculum sp. NTUH-O15-33]WNX84352.1 hypothetical protein RWV98_17525 [Agathobaculum sp. NTUH-O15-33]WNX85266.1 hypothetical protein RWV98_03030 [Agathobaculum sp. NTUH-O15-33]